MSPLSQVNLPTYPLERFHKVVEPDVLEHASAVLERSRDLLDGRTVWHVNSTAEGGGVAEMLRSLLAYARGSGIDARWAVIEGEPEFFRITKRLHHALHGSLGDGSPLGAQAARAYGEVLNPNLKSFLDDVRPGDTVFLHDPQTAGMAASLMAHGATVIWRCHIGTEDSTPETEEGWSFLAPHIRDVPLRIFSRKAYIPAVLNDNRSKVVQPSIDAFSTKNEELEDDVARAILTQAGLITGPPGDGPRSFTRGDGSTGLVERQASVLREDAAPVWNDPLVVQVSRWDPLKDHGGVMQGFASFVDRYDQNGRTQLVLAGPDVSGVTDDPEGGIVLEELKGLWATFPKHLRSRMHLASLPMEDVGENAAIVNALQRHATIIVQKSLREGFGLTLTEAMWKSRPVIASRVGGLQDQVTHEEDGLLLDNPTDVEALGDALGRIIKDRPLATRLGSNAKERVRANFLGIRHLAQYHDLLNTLLS
ncbi:MAG: glycosyl transferase family 1 [Dehalococcoidia bacterium]|nr:glycosyl transferase family 1 [Dehalococcoidia bacterium]